MRLLMVVIYVILVAGSIALSWHVTISGKATLDADDWKNFGVCAGVGIAAVSGLLASGATFVNLDKQAKASQDLEKIKQTLGQSIPAYRALYGAASRYYRSLASLEEGSVEIEAVTTADRGMIDAEGDTLFVADAFLRHWQEFWRHSRYIREMVERDGTTPESRKNIWVEKCKALAHDLTKMREVAQALVRT